MAVLGGVASLLLGEHPPTGPAARELIDHERDPRFYPDPVLLSDRGRRLHRAVLWPVRTGAGALAVALVLYSLAAHA